MSVFDIRPPELPPVLRALLAAVRAFVDTLLRG